MSALCRIGLHHWDIWAADLRGHESRRWRRCLRCRRGQVQQCSYFGKPLGRWKDES